MHARPDTPGTDQPSATESLSSDQQPTLSFATALGTNITTQATPEITALARALKYDPMLIFDYVHNHIDYVPYYGSLKGAGLTLLDGSGNDFDQASLLIALLRVSGYPAQFGNGYMEIPGAQMANWLGVDQDWTVITDVLNNGGIPKNMVYWDGTAQLERVWVKATINGVVYPFDPAFKSYTPISKPVGFDLVAATGYSRSALLSAAGGTLGTNYVQNVNTANLAATLSGYATNLVTTIKTQYPNWTLKEIIGGRSIVPVETTAYATSYPFPTSDMFSWDEVPMDKIATLRIQHQGIDQTFNIPEIAGKPLTITYAGSNNHPELWLDHNVLLASGNATTVGNKYNLNITVNHHYSGGLGDTSNPPPTYSLVSGASYAIVSDFGGTSDQLISKRQKELDQFRAGGLDDTSEQVRGETLNIMGLTWMKELSLADSLILALAENGLIIRHRVGIMAQEASYYIDIKDINISPFSRHVVSSENSYKTSALIGSALEHGILQQLMGSDNPGISTMRIFDIANAQPNQYKIFWADSSNYLGTIRPQLQGYSTNSLDDINGYIDKGYTVILPERGDVGFSDRTWHGAGYITRLEKADGLSLVMKIEGGYKGAFSSDPGYLNPQIVSQNAQYIINNTTSPDTIGNQINDTTRPPSSDEPVDMASGAYLFDSTDLVLSSNAGGLSFGRSYNSNMNHINRGLGNGWTHNHMVFFERHSDGNPGLGLRQPVDAAALIAAMVVNLDLMANEDNIRGWVVASLVSKWAVDQLIDNAATVNIGNKVMEYVRLADGSYSPPPGLTTKLSFNSDNTASLIERFGTRYDFNANDRLAKITDIDGNPVTYTYNGDVLSSISDNFGHTLSFANYILLLGVSDSSGRSISFNYDSNGNMVSYTDPEGKIWYYGYDGNHRMTSLTNPLGVATAVNTYDALGRVDTQTVPRKIGGSLTNATYNFYFSGFRNIEEDPLENQTIYYLDEKGRTFAKEDALGSKSYKYYDGQDHVIFTVDPRMNGAIFQYDGNNNLKKAMGPLSGTEYDTEYDYDTNFRPTDIYLSLNGARKIHVSNFTYDSKHHPLKTTTYPVTGKTIEVNSTYYTNGLRKTNTDGMGTVTTMTYDSYGNPDTTQVATEPVVNYTYSPAGQMLDLTDQVLSKTSLTYDKRGLLKTKTDPLGKVTTYTYYDDGSLNTIADRNSNVITYNYTQSGKMEKITYQDSSTVSFAYDKRDNLYTMTDSVGTTTYTYDAANRLASVADPYGFTVSYQYDAAGNIVEITYPGPGNKKVHYTYDSLNRMDNVTIDWLNPVLTANFDYNETGLLERVDNFNGAWASFGYDNANRLTDVQNYKTTVPPAIATYHFTLDNNGNRTFINTNKTEPITGDLSTGTTSYTYNAKKTRLTNAGSTGFTYDSEGQLTSKGSTACTFDYEHRLKTFGTSSTYSYDGMGKMLKALRSGTETRYIYDAAGNILAEANSSNTITRYYIYGQNGLLAMVTSAGVIYCYHFDGNGNTIAMTDSTQNVVNKYAYAPFGTIVAQSETVTNQPFKFVGQHGVMTEANGLYYMRARFYDPTVGRFISEDPSGFGGGDVNLYVYCNNNPVLLIDPLGLCGCPPGTTGTTQKMLVTGYDNSYQSTGKNPGDSGYGLTASGSVAATGTIAAPKSYPFGAQMVIPGYGLGTVLDRGGAIKGSHIDIWFPTTQQAINWGAQYLQVTVCHE